MFSAPYRSLAQAARDVWDDKANLILVNMLSVMACLTVIFAPPAVFGLYYTANRLAAGESLGLTALFQGGRKYFLQSWLWAVINIGVFLIISANLSFYQLMPGTWGYMLQYFFLFVLLFWLTIQFFALAYFMEMEEKKVLLALRNGWFTLMASPGYSLVLVVLAMIVVAFSAALLFPIILFTPSLLACWGTRAVAERLATLGVRR